MRCADAAAGLMNDTGVQAHILAPLEVFGVDAFEPGQLVIKARIKTVPLKQWLVGRELRKRIARVFSERGIQHADAADGGGPAAARTARHKAQGSSHKSQQDDAL